MGSLRHLDALGTGGAFRTSLRHPVTGVDGSVLAELSLVPRLYITRNLLALRRATPLTALRRAEALRTAGELFLGEVDAVTLDDHERAVSRASGVALPVVRAASGVLSRSAKAAAATVAAARPAGVVADWRDEALTGAVWTRRGCVLAVLAPGNHPATHTVWLEALVMGYRVAVRPSNREPFTAHRLVSALRTAGFGSDHVVLLPTEHARADALVQAADLSLVYGGDDVVRRYAGRPDVYVQGPGRSKVLLADGFPERHLETVVESVAGYGGTACVNASAVFVDGDTASVARRLADALAAIPMRAPDENDAVLPAHDIGRARALEAHLRANLAGGELLSQGSLVHRLPGGEAVLRPAVILLNRSDAPQTSIELPFPCVWVAPWSREDGIRPLRNTLTLTAFVQDEALVSDLVDEASISNVHIGDHPTHVMAPDLPHDGFLAEFLMRAKTVLLPHSDDHEQE